MPESFDPDTGPTPATSPGLLLHATCLAIDGRGVLLRGPSGAGKSDLALRMITQPLLRPTAAQPSAADLVAVRLVSDDQVRVLARRGSLWAQAPTSIAGKLEVRGLGIVDVPHEPLCRLVLSVDLVASSSIERMPISGRTLDILALSLPRIELDPFEPSAPAKLALALGRLGGHLS